MMTPVQQQLGAAGLNSCSSRFSTPPLERLPVFWQGLNPRVVLALSAEQHMRRAMRWRPPKASGPGLLMDGWCAVEATVTLKHPL